MTDQSTPSHRAAPRDSLLLLAELRVEADGRTIGSARIRNLSATGLMADCDTALKEGDRLLLTLRGVGDVAATLNWCRDGRIGLVFDQPIDPMAARRPSTNTGTTIAAPYKAIGEPSPLRSFPRKPR